MVVNRISKMGARGGGGGRGGGRGRGFGGGAGAGAAMERYISGQIKKGVSGSAIADKLVANGADRASALMMYSIVGAKMNMAANPGMSANTAFKLFTGINK